MRAINSSLPFYVRLQRLFYIIPPSESMFENVDDVPDYVGESNSMFQVLMLIELIILWFQCKPLPRVSDLISSVGAGIASRLTGLIFKRVIDIAMYCYVWENYRLVELPWDSVWTWIFALLAVDFGYYWIHRCAHGNNINTVAEGHALEFVETSNSNHVLATYFSKLSSPVGNLEEIGALIDLKPESIVIFQVHHSSEDYNLSTALRQSVLQSYSSWIFYMPLALCVPPPIYHVHQQFNLLYQFWIHTEVIDWLGPLEYIINTPSAHRVHHGRNRYCIDKNYGGTFIFFDILFGTYEAEKRDDLRESVVYGLVHPLESRNPIYTQVCHWQYILVTAWNRPGFLNKVKTFLYGPGWEPGKPRMGEITDIPDIKYPQAKYETPVPLWYNLYAIVHFASVLALHEVAHEHVAIMSQLHVTLSIAFILVSLTCIGALFDQRWYAPYTEFARCVCTSIYLWNELELFDYVSLPLIILFTASSFIYGLVIYRQHIGGTAVGKKLT